MSPTKTPDVDPEPQEPVKDDGPKATTMTRLKHAQEKHVRHLQDLAESLGTDWADYEDLGTEDAARALEGLAGDLQARLEVIDAAPPALVDAIAAAMLEAGQVTKSSVNTDQGYKFASAEAILGAVRGPLLARGVVLLPHPVDYGVETITSRSGSKGTLITASIDFVFRNGRGEELTVAGWHGVGQDYGDKAIGKAYTNAIKTFIRTAWLLPTEHDDPEASPAGERVRDDAPTILQAPTPAWAKPTTATTTVKLRNDLVRAVGEDEADKILEGITQHVGGGVPVIATMALRAMVVRLERHGMIPPDPGAAAAAQDAGAEAGDPPAPDPEPDPPAPDDLFAPPAGDGPNVDDLPEPGSMPMPELPEDRAVAFGVLRAAGCICPDPLAQKSELGELDDGCPLDGHGIPF